MVSLLPEISAYPLHSEVRGRRCTSNCRCFDRGEARAAKLMEDAMTTDAAKPTTGDGEPQVTRELSEWTAVFSNRDVTPSARTWATHTLLDWAACTVAGAREPLAEILTSQYAEEEGPCTVIATGERARPHDAAMLNGSAGHALDYDDVNSSLHGHPSVPVAPA